MESIVSGGCSEENLMDAEEQDFRQRDVPDDEKRLTLVEVSAFRTNAENLIESIGFPRSNVCLSALTYACNVMEQTGR